MYIYIYINVFFVCSTLKHQLHADVLRESGICISNAVSVSSKKLLNVILFWYC